MNTRAVRSIMIFVLVCGICSVNYLCCKKAGDRTAFGISQLESPIKDDDDVVSMAEMQNVFRKIYELYADRIVFISTENTVKVPVMDIFFNQYYQEQKKTGLGSGFIISEDGYVCTNYHVIAPEGSVVDKVRVIAEDKDYEAEIRGYDEYKDIAILKIKPSHKLKPVFFGDSSKVKVGDWAVALGNPYGLAKSFTVGNVSAVGRTNINEEGDPYFQTDAAINPGNSGGPLINIKGEVIGINRMIYSQSGGYQGIGFAIPINSVIESFANLEKKMHRQKGYMGVQISALNEEVAKYHGYPDNFGIVIENMMKGSPAYSAGLRRFDIVYAINGKKITSDTVFFKEIERSGAGTQVTLDVFRKGARKQLQITLMARPK